MDINDLLERVKLAHAENVSAGSTMAWSRADGVNVKWDELLEVLEFLADFDPEDHAEVENEGGENV